MDAFENVQTDLGPKLGNPRQPWILDFTPWIWDSGNWILMFVSGTWILDSNLYWNSGFQSPGFPIPPEKFFWIPESSSKYLPDSGIADSLTWGKNSWRRDGRLTNPVFQQCSASTTRGEMS